MTLYEELMRPPHGRAQSKHPAKARRCGRARQHAQQFGDFVCCHCRLGVSAALPLAGVHNRNHCPYCLWSKHVDLRQPGDRLCACKAPMPPAGLTFKRVVKKYTPAGQGGVPRGELMLVHRCSACGALSLNRLAADDSPARLWEVFEASLSQPLPALDGIAVLGPADREQLRAIVLAR